jgi:hypothetical protein
MGRGLARAFKHQRARARVCVYVSVWVHRFYSGSRHVRVGSPPPLPPPPQPPTFSALPLTTLATPLPDPPRPPPISAGAGAGPGQPA